MQRNVINGAGKFDAPEAKFGHWAFAEVSQQMVVDMFELLGGVGSTQVHVAKEAQEFRFVLADFLFVKARERLSVHTRIDFHFLDWLRTVQLVPPESLLPFADNFRGAFASTGV